jgi:AraC-like DNA-binding protein
MINLVRSATLSGFSDVARQVGLDPGRMLTEFRLPGRCLEEPELRVPVDAVRRLLEAAAERGGTQGFGLMMAESRQLSDLGPLGLLVREQPTLRLAIEAYVRHGRQLNDSLFLTIEESGDVIILREELIVGHSGPVRQSTELAIGIAYRMLRTFLGPPWRPRRVCFAHDPPRDRSVHDRVFGRNVVEFGHDFNGIVCARGDLELPNPNADPGIARLASAMLESGHAGTAAPMTSEVRDLVVLLLGTGSCTVERAAEHLGVDRRTVHRHLAGEGETFSGIVDSVRRELAARYVGDRRRSLADVSAMLGFAAPSSFSRWYRQTFGVNPARDPERRATGVHRSTGAGRKS